MLRRSSKRHGKHDKIGAPSHARRIEVPVWVVFPGDNARYRRAVGKRAAVLVEGTRQEAFDDRLVAEGGVVRVDAGVQDANENPFPWRGIGAELPFQMRVRLRNADRSEAPLQLDGGVLRIGRDPFVGKAPDLLVVDAAVSESLDARLRRQGAGGQSDRHQGNQDARAGNRRHVLASLSFEGRR